MVACTSNRYLAPVATLSRSVAALRVSGDELMPDDVSRLLGAEPSLAYARGDEILSKHGASRIAKSGLWSCSGVDSEPADIDSQVTGLLQRLTPDLDTWQRLADAFHIDLFCGWFMERLNEGVEISPETLMALAQRRVVLSLASTVTADSAPSRPWRQPRTNGEEGPLAERCAERRVSGHQAFGPLRER